MVAKLTIAERFVSLPEAVVSGRMQLVRFTRQDALAMVQLGIIPEDASTELLNGMVILKDRASLGQDITMVGNDHTKCVERWSNLRTKINSPIRHVRSQQPLVCTETHVPEPDFMVLRGQLEDYPDPPTAADAYCVIEVADSSYERDAGVKLKGYARAGIQQYIIVNLRNRTAEIYTQADVTAGTYAPPQVLTAEQTIALRVGDADVFEVRLSDVLP